MSKDQFRKILAAFFDEIIEFTGSLEPFRVVIVPSRDGLVHVTKQRFCGVGPADGVFRGFRGDVVTQPVDRDAHAELALCEIPGSIDQDEPV